MIFTWSRERIAVECLSFIPIFHVNGPPFLLEKMRLKEDKIELVKRTQISFSIHFKTYDPDFASLALIFFRQYFKNCTISTKSWKE